MFSVGCVKIVFLVGGLEHGFYDFPYIGNDIIPTDFQFFRGVGQPPTSIYRYIDLFIYNTYAYRYIYI